MTPQKKVEMLEHAKGFIDAAWIRGDWVVKNPDSPTGVSVCAMGALRMVNKQTTSLEKKQEISNELALALAAALPVPYKGTDPRAARHQVIHFNDGIRGGKENVQKLFERAICQAKLAAKNAASKGDASSPTRKKRAPRKAKSTPPSA